MPFGVNPPPPGPPRHLQHRIRGQHRNPVVAPLRKRRKDRRARRHVDPGSQGLGGKHGLDEAPLEQLLHETLPERQAACGETTFNLPVPSSIRLLRSPPCQESLSRKHESFFFQSMIKFSRHPF